MFTEYYAKPKWLASLFSSVSNWIDPNLSKRMSQRFHHELSDQIVRTNFSLALKQRMARKKFPTLEQYYAWASGATADWLKKEDLGNTNVFYGFLRNVHPRLLNDLKSRGIVSIGDQIIAPAAVEQQEARIQAQRFPGWEKGQTAENLDMVKSFEEESWSACDQIICGSQYVKDGLISQGVPAEKTWVVPYAPSGSDLPLIERALRTGPVKVGFVGQVNLRKGVPYFFEVAKRFKPTEAKFVMIGPIQITDKALAEKGHVELLGSVPRKDVAKHLASFDIFFFPSTCEGCAGAVLEAMDTGLPIVTTPQSGTVVREGADGFVRHYEDIDGLTQSLAQLIASRDLRLTMGLSSRQRMESYSMSWYCQELTKLTNQFLASRS